MRVRCASEFGLAAALALVVTARGVPPCAEESGSKVSKKLSLDELAATREKPLFSPTRQRAPPPSSSATVAPPSDDSKQTTRDEPQYALAGIITSPSETMVLLRDLKTSELVKIRSGDSLGSWKVSTNSNYSVELRNGERKFLLEMFADQ